MNGPIRKCSFLAICLNSEIESKESIIEKRITKKCIHKIVVNALMFL